MNTITMNNTPNNLSFFKLPLIFIGTFFVIYYGTIHAFNFLLHDIQYQYLPQIITNSFFSLLLPLFLFFVTAIFCCQKYRLHSVSSNGPIVGLIAIILAVLYFGWAQLYGWMFGLVIRQLSEVFYSGNMLLWITIFSYFTRIIGYILFVVVLCFLFYLISNKNKTTRPSFQLEGVIGSRIYSVMYSILMLFSSIMFISFSFVSMLPTLFSQFDYYDIGYSLLVVIPIMVILLFVFYLIFYFATRNSFKRIELTLKLGKLIATVLITYFFNFLAGLILTGLMFIFSRPLVSSFYYSSYESVIVVIATLSVAFLVINIILQIVLSRLSVKIMYS